MNFAGKVALVTGATKGIGKAVTDIFIRQGGTVIAVGRNGSALEALKEEYGEKLLSYQCDVADEQAVRDLVKAAIDKTGRIDILINNAGIYMEDKAPFVQQNSSIWKKKIDINILGTLYMTHAVLPHMIAQRGGRIVNVASVAGIYGIRDMVDYSLTKGAILSFTTSLAREVGEYNITVNAVSPGNINTYNDLPELSYMNRSGTPEECANVIAFLASDEASFVSGSNYVVDGSRKKI